VVTAASPIASQERTHSVPWISPVLFIEAVSELFFGRQVSVLKTVMLPRNRPKLIADTDPPALIHFAKLPNENSASVRALLLGWLHSALIPFNNH